MSDNSWWIYKGTGVPHDGIQALPAPPNWRTFQGEIIVESELKITIDDADTKRHIGDRISIPKDLDKLDENERREIEMVNAALFLRRPLLVTGKPGSGKSSLAYMVAKELKLGPVLHWPITTRSTRADGLYQYDAIGRLHDASYEKSRPGDSALQSKETEDIGRYIHLGPLGTALLPRKYPRVLLIDEIDKSDIDLPNDLLHMFEEGSFEITELKRMVKGKESVRVDVMPHDGNDESDRVPVINGHVECNAFPFIVLTSNGERDFPPAFLRRCLRLKMEPPSSQRLTEIIRAHFRKDGLDQQQLEQLVADFLLKGQGGDLATDQLLNAIYMTSKQVSLQDKEALSQALLKYLN